MAEKKIFITSYGHYYRAEKPIDPSDACKPLATEEMHLHLTETPMGIEEFNLKVHEAHVKSFPVKFFETPGQKQAPILVKK